MHCHDNIPCTANTQCSGKAQISARVRHWHQKVRYVKRSTHDASFRSEDRPGILHLAFEFRLLSHEYARGLVWSPALCLRELIHPDVCITLTRLDAPCKLDELIQAVMGVGGQVLSYRMR